MNRTANVALSAMLAAASSMPVGRTFAADYIQPYQEAPGPGPCSDGWVLGTISSRFDYQVKHVPNLPQVSILEFHRIYQRRYEPASEDWPIPRVYCVAQVALSDGLSRDIWYLVEYGQGFASIGDNVEFCVAGFDRWMVYNGGCRVLRE